MKKIEVSEKTWEYVQAALLRRGWTWPNGEQRTPWPRIDHGVHVCINVHTDHTLTWDPETAAATIAITEDKQWSVFDLDEHVQVFTDQIEDRRRIFEGVECCYLGDGWFEIGKERLTVRAAIALQEWIYSQTGGFGER